MDLKPSSFYYKKAEGSKGKSKSTITFKQNGTFEKNEMVVFQIEELLQKEFVDYGYRKVTWYLRNELLYVINFKKVYDLMKKNNLLRPKIRRSQKGKRWVEFLVPRPSQPFEHLEFDIKYIYIAGERRNALLLTIIDIMSRMNIAWMLQWSIKKEDVKALFQYILESYRLPRCVTVRNDNGSQMESDLVRKFLASEGILQEFTRPATPQQNGHIEAYHSIVDRTICQIYEIKNIEQGNDIFGRFEYFYNHERIHSGIGYISPIQYLNKLGLKIHKDFACVASD
ncbi:MAG: DDE-type integrase/transposase/recombinase [Saprospiraceae bacterium]